MCNWILGSGQRVVDRHKSHVHEKLTDLLPEALARINADGRRYFTEQVDFGRPVGETSRVATKPGDQIVYAQRANRSGLTRFVKNRKAESCSAVTVVLKKDDRDDYYILITAFVGYRAEPEPWDKKATPQSSAFWSSQALVWGAEEVIPGTETVMCPW